LTTHWVPERESESWVWMLGAAMATMVWSMKVMATAKSIAISARFLDDSAGRVSEICVAACERVGVSGSWGVWVVAS
jgi:hypothetical protein